ncbi:DUF58 domain-containing protein [Gracilibacillus sp. YIM 98692]|uniref:DUF58 domain-containing protein n=1 Tax=Gracilibacillus sp. YIM 98692 TaxID=2663532 RepID=UPI0013D6C13D|nr:DUF58 domain-containing protein [Gracilibacillus sp. YIM 98692]
MKSLVIKLWKMLQLILLIAGLFIFAMFQGGFVSWFLFYSITPILLYMIFIPFYPLHHWHVDRKLSQTYVYASGSVELTILLRRRNFFPLLYVEIEEICPATLHKKDVGKQKFRNLTHTTTHLQKRRFKKVLFLGFRRALDVTVPLSQLPRGKHTFSTISIKIGDPFGFVEKEERFLRDDPLYVYPAIQGMRWTQNAYSIEAGTLPSLVHDERLTNMVSGVREYTPGDRFSWIDWKTTARKNTVMTKEFEQEKDSQLYILLDVEEQHVNQPLVFEAAVEWTMGIIDGARKTKQQLTFQTMGKTERSFSPQQIQFQYPVIQSYLANISQEKPAIPLSSKLSSANGFIPRGSVVILIICSLNQSLIHSLIELYSRNVLVKVCLISPKEEIRNGDRNHIENLKMKGIPVQLITEEDLQREEWEVK